MQSSRDSSVWRTLAVAFGDGLAFGVGVHLTQSAARRAMARPATSDFHPRVTGIHPAVRPAVHPGVQPGLQPGIQPAPQPAPQPRIEPASNSNAILSLIDGRFREVGGQIDRRLAELELKVQVALSELNADFQIELDGRDRSHTTDAEARIDALRTEVSALLAEQRHTASDDLRTLRGQMITLQKEFAETLARLVDDQISRSITDRLQPLEERLHVTIREELRTAAESAATAAQQAFDAKVQTLHEEVAAKDRQLADLRGLLEEHDRTVLDLVVSLGHSCLQAAERISIPVSAQMENPPSPEPPAASSESPASIGDLPGFAQPSLPKPLWRLPIVSSFLMATCGLLLLHYI